MTRLDEILDTFINEGKFKLNDDKLHVAMIKKGLITNKDIHGEYYCPCKVQKIHNNICPCTGIKETGVCHCKLFVSNDDFQTK